MCLSLLLFSNAEAWGPTYDTFRIAGRRSSALNSSGRKEMDGWQHSVDSKVSDIYFPSLYDKKSLLWEGPEHANSFDFMDDQCIGEECEEECLIPDHYRLNESDTPDVLALLGIRRSTSRKPELQAWQ